MLPRTANVWLNAAVRGIYLPVVWLLALLCTCPPQAFAFKFDSALTDGCHEMITVAALSKAGWPDGRRAPGLVGDEVFIARDLPCQVPGSKDDAWVLSMVIGNRWNDLHGHEAIDLPGLADVHGDPHDQDEHCLRSPEDDGPEGDAQALRKCQRFIMSRIDAALAERDVVDLDERTTARVALSLQGPVELSLQRYGFEVGRALHALQDSFAHTLRSPDGTRVRHVLNYVDVAHSDDYTESRDGHRHIDGLDLCTGTEPRRRRRSLATQASRELLEALVQSDHDHAARRRAAEQVVERWLTHESGCTRDNGYCGASELAEPDGGCSVASPRGSRGAGLGVASLFGLWALRRRPRRRRGRSRAWAAATRAPALLLLLLVIGNVTRVSAQSAPRTPPIQVESSPFGAVVHGAIAIDEPAFAWRVGGRFRIDPRFEVGLQVEGNPWFSLETETLHPGVLSLIASVSLDWLEAKGVTVRSTFHLGGTWLLFDLFGAPQGSLGPLVGLSLLGLSWQLDTNFRLLIEPAEVMMPVVQILPVPYYYRQYRFAIGLQWNP